MASCYLSQLDNMMKPQCFLERFAPILLCFAHEVISLIWCIFTVYCMALKLLSVDVTLIWHIKVGCLDVQLVNSKIKLNKKLHEESHRRHVHNSLRVVQVSNSVFFSFAIFALGCTLFLGQADPEFCCKWFQPLHVVKCLTCQCCCVILRSNSMMIEQTSVSIRSFLRYCDPNACAAATCEEKKMSHACPHYLLK